MGANTLKDVIALARAKPDALNYGSPGPLTSGHLSMELLKLQAGINIILNNSQPTFDHLEDGAWLLSPVSRFKDSFRRLQ